MRRRTFNRSALVATAVTVMVAGGVIAGCGSSSSSSSSSSSPSSSASGSSTGSASASTGSGKHVSVAFLNQIVTSYGTAMTSSMQRAAAADNASVKAFNGNGDPSTQSSQCQTAISSGSYQAIIEYPVSGAAGVACARQALAAHIAFIPVDSPIGPDPTSTAVQVPGIKAQVLGSVIGLDVNATAQLVKLACAHFPPPCTVVQTASVPAIFFSAYKLSHEQPIFKSHGYKILATPVIGNFDDPDGVKSAIETTLSKGQKIDVIVSDDDASAQGAVQLKKAGKLPGTLVIGDGGDSVALKSISQGYEFGTVYDVPATEAAVALREAAQLVRGQPVPAPATKTQLDLAKYYVVTKQNVGKVKAEW